MMELRWKQGTGLPPIGAIITSHGDIVIWQVLQHLIISDYIDGKDEWKNVALVSCPDD